MDYKKAASIRKKGLTDLIAEKKFKEGQGLGSSIGQAISEKMKAKSMGFKEKFHPLNMVRAMTGSGAVGKSIRTVAGRAIGASEEDIKYFGGYGKKKKLKQSKDKKDPLFTTVDENASMNLEAGDSSANILAKIYRFMEKTQEVSRLDNEIEQAFREEQLEEEERRHKKLIESLTGKKTETAKPEEDDGVDSFIKKLLNGIKTTFELLLMPLKGLLSLVSGLSSIIMPLIAGIAGSVLSVIAKSAGSIVKILSIPLIALMKKLLGGIFSIFLQSSLASAASRVLLGPVGAVLSVLGVGASVAALTRESQETRMGPEAIELEKKHAEELRELPASTKSVQNTTYEEREQLIAVKARQREETKIVVEKFEKENLTPAMEKIGFKPTTRDKDSGEMIYKNAKGEVADFTDYKTALSGEDWFTKLLMKLTTGEEISPTDYTKREVEKFVKEGTDKVLEETKDFATELKNKITPNFNLPTANDSKVLPSSSLVINDNTMLEPSSGTVVVNGTRNNIGGGPPQVTTGDSTPVRDSNLQKIQGDLVPKLGSR